MVDSQASAARKSLHPWVIGGSLLLASVVIGVSTQPALALIAGGNIVGTVLFSAASLVFAFGIRGVGSVTARRPLGTAALTGLAIWVLASSVIQGVLTSDSFGPVNLRPLTTFGYVDSFATFAVAIVAVIQIARAGSIPAPWNWAPAWTLAAVTVLWLVQQFIPLGDTNTAPPMTLAIITLDGIIRTGSPVFLGVLAIALANRPLGARAYPKVE